MTQTSSLPEQQQAGNYETHQQVPAVTAPADPVTSNETVAADPLKSLATFAPPRIAISKSENHWKDRQRRFYPFRNRRRIAEFV